MADNRIEVLLQFSQSGLASVQKATDSLARNLNSLSRVNTTLMASTGKVFPNFAQQAQIINSMHTPMANMAKDLVKLRQEGSLFSKIFAGDSKRALNEFFNEGYRFGLFSNQAGSLRSRLQRELSLMKVAAADTSEGMRQLTSPERFRIMGHVFAQQVDWMNTKMLNWGKNMQWVGRQLITGLSLPLFFAGSYMLRSYLTFEKAVTGLERFLAQTGLQGEQFARVFTEELEPAIDKVSAKTGLFRDEVVDIAAAWVAAGYDINNGMMALTDLTAQLSLVTQGELSTEKSMELIRSVQATWNLSIQDTVESLKQLVLIGNETSLTLLDIADALPVASSAAENLNIEAAELAALLAGMREQGVPATQAAQTLKFSFNRLIVPTQKAVEAWEALGNVPSLDDILWDKTGSGRGMQGMEEMFKILGQLDQQTQSEMAGILFGGYRADRMLKLIKAFNREGSQLDRALETATDSSRALALWQEQLAIVSESSAQKFQVMRVVLVTLFQKFGEVLFPYVERLGNVVLDFLNKLEQAPAGLKNFIMWAGVLLASLGPIVYIFGQLTEATAVLGKTFISGPLKSIFQMGGHGFDAFGLSRLATESGNPWLDMLSGIQAVQAESSATTAAAASAAVSALEAEGVAVNQLTAQYIRLNAVKNSDLMNLPQLASLSDEALMGLTGSGLGAAQEVAEEASRALNRADILSLLNERGIAWASPQEIADILGFDNANLDDIAEVMADRTNKVSKKFSRSYLVDDFVASLSAAAPRATNEIAEEIAETTAAGASQGMITASNSPKVQKEAQGFWAKIKSYMFSGQRSFLSQPATGSGTAGLFNLVFGNPVKLIATIALVTGLLANIPSLMKGWADEFSEVGKIFGGIFTRAVEGLSALFGKTDEIDGTKEAFVSLGDIIGKTVLGIAKAIELMSNVLIPVFRFFAQVGGEVISVLTDLGNVFNFTATGASGFAVAISRILLLVGGLFVITKVAAAVKALSAAMAAFSAVRTLAMGQGIAYGIGNAISAVGAFKTSLASTAPLLAKVLLNPWVALPALALTAGVAVSLFFNKVDRAAEKSAEMIDNLRDNIEELNEALTSGPTIDSSISERLIDDILSSAVGVYSEREVIFNMELDTDNLRDDLAAADEKIENAPPAERKIGLKFDFNNLELRDTGIGGQIQEAIRLDEMIEANIVNTLRQVKDLNTQNLQIIRNQTDEKIKQYQYQLQINEIALQQAISSGASRETISKLQSEVFYYRALIRAAEILNSATRSSVVLYQARETSFRSFLDAVLREGRGAGRRAGEEAGQEFADAFESQLGQLTNRVTDAIMESFEESTEARMDAFEDSMEAQLDAFDRRAEAQLEAVDKEVEAIDKKIDKLDEENEKEEWLQQQREWRQRRRELLMQQELAIATAYQERLKAIHEGRTDDARLIELQMYSSEQDTQRQLRDLNQEEREGREQHREDKMRERYEKQKEALQRERELLEEQLDAQRDALQESLDNQRDALQEQIENQRNFLQNMLEEYNEFLPKNEKQWDKHYAGMAKIAKQHGVDINEIQKEYGEDWGQSIRDGLRDARDDAFREAAALGDSVAKGASAGARQGAISEADLKLYRLLSDFLNAQGQGLHPIQMAEWVRKISAAMQGASESARNRINRWGGLSTDTGNEGGTQRRGSGIPYHMGGYVAGGRKKGDEVPAVLQSGEYVLKKEAVKRLGVDTLNSINTARGFKKYHSGGVVSATMGGVLAGAMPYALGSGLISGVNSMLMGNILRQTGIELANQIIGGAGGTGAAIPGLAAPTASGIWNPGLAAGKWGRQATSPAEMGFSTSGNTRVKSFIASARSAFPNWLSNLRFDTWDYARRGYNGAAGPPWSQHSWGNALDFNAPSYGANDVVAWWAYRNRQKLSLADIIWRQENHAPGDNPHIHVEFSPYANDMWSPPIAHSGGIFTGKGVKKFGDMRFEAPALLQPGEAVLSRGVTRALASIGESGGAGNVNITFKVNGDFYGDENSYRKLHNTLERVGNKIARERGVPSGTVVKLDGF